MTIDRGAENKYLNGDMPDQNSASQDEAMEEGNSFIFTPNFD